MKIIDALKKLYAAQGGTPADVAGMKKTADVIEAIADNGGGGGGGGGGVLFVTTTSADGTTWTNANHTATEIVSALENGQLPVLYGVVAGSTPVAGYFATVLEGWALFYSQGNPKPLAVSSTGEVTVMP